MTIPNIKLADGTSVPALAFGTATTESSTGIKQNMVDRITKAINNGYRHFDTAEGYATERELGIALAESGLPRTEFFITSKVKVRKGSIDDIQSAIRRSLADAKLDYFDLYLIHNPWFTKQDHDISLEEAWAEMEKVKTSGLARNIGISNFRPETIQRILDCAQVHTPAVNQIELHPYCFEEDTVEFGRKHGIITASYGPLIPVARHNQGPLSPLLEELTSKYSVTPAQILLRWQIQQGFIAVTSSTNDERQRTQSNVDSFELSPDEVQKITDVGKQHPFRYFGWGSGRQTYAMDAKPKPLPNDVKF
jgi:diketogulonate reductase-like aldo/keto reductase